MAIGLLLIGLLLIDTGLRGTHHELGARLMVDFLGPGGFIGWFGAILIIGAIGFIPGFRTPVRYLLALLLVVAVIANNGVFAQLQAALQQATTSGPAPAIAPDSSTTGLSSGTGTSSGVTSAVGTAVSAASATSGGITAITGLLGFL